MPEQEERATRAVYDAVADAYADHFRGTEAEQGIELAMIDHLVSLLPEHPLVLDAGCGAGRTLPVLAERGCLVRGIDLSPEMVRRARTDHPGFDVQVGSLTALPHPDASFDGVVAWYSTIHNPDEDLPVMLREMARVLRPGGCVLVAFQTGQGPREVGEGFRRRGMDVELVRYHRSVAQMRSALATAGLTCVASLERAAVGTEQDGQAVVIGRREVQPNSARRPA